MKDMEITLFLMMEMIKLFQVLTSLTGKFKAKNGNTTTKSKPTL